jgi:5-methylcytosine-specific restriction protein B
LIRINAMPPLDLTSLEVLRKLEADYRAARADPSQQYATSCRNLTEYLEQIAKASVEERATLEFQQRLWDDNPVAVAGQGAVSVDKALADEGFRRWLAERSFTSIPSDRAEAIDALQILHDEILARLQRSVSRTPRLKTVRVLAALFPHHFTTIADVYRISWLHQVMFTGPKVYGVEAHANVLARLAEALGPVPAGLSAWVERMTLPWFVLERYVESAPEATSMAPLQPLPAGRRRSGMTAIKGSLNGVLRVLDFMKGGATREDLHTFLKQDAPDVKKGWLNTSVYVLRAELGVIEERDGKFFPTESGRELLETEDPSTLAPWLLTRILGVDHVLVHLRDQGPTSTKELFEKLRAVNPGWTTNFTSGAILKWLRAFGTIEVGPNTRLQLTQRGREWAARVHWVPEHLSRKGVEEDGLEIVEEELAEPNLENLSVPALKEILAAMPSELAFPQDKVAALHAGLWAHHRRHFAILTGLSGSGKTSLARAYAKALLTASGVKTAIKPHLLTVPVQPGWTDPTSLLGYPHPLSKEDYVSTDFLEVLRACEAAPTVPHVVVLDEMNLAHPEQYLAPLLSAMETGDPIVLHREPEAIDDVPAELRSYPPNLVLIGTVNMDETTHGLSDKVLDRAVILDFWEVDLATYPGWGKRGIPTEQETHVRQLLADLIEVLAPVRLHFAWRVVDEVLDFLARSGKDGHLMPDAALDWIVHAKVLPKLRGHDSPQFRTAFESCQGVLKQAGLKRSAAKAGELLEDLKSTGSARFWR